MEKKEGATIIREMVSGITSNPAQFHFKVEINAVGQSISASGGGTGLSISASGGGPGSTTIGQNVGVSLNNSDIKIAQENATAEINNQMNQAIQSLNTIADELDKENSDNSLLSNIYDSLKKHWIPAAITSVVGAILKATVDI